MPKPRKVEESAASYKAASKPGRTTRQPKVGAPKSVGPKFLKQDEAEVLAHRIFAERRELLHKLAQ